jgi:DNA-binding response OmpR family regulator
VRRRTAQLRFRQAFVAQAAAQVHELAAELRVDADAAEPAVIELRRLAETAGTLNLPTVAQAALDAATELEGTEGGPRSLRRIANALRHSGGRLRFGPIVVVGLSAEEADDLARAAPLCCEPLRLYPDLATFAAGLHTEQPTAVVLPVEDVEAVAQLVGRERFPVLVHAAPHVWKPRVVALEAGAHAVLTRPFGLRDVTRVVRWHTQGAHDVHDVLVLADPDPSRDGLVRAIEDLGMVARLAADPAELPTLLDRSVPSAVVLGPSVAGTPALSLALVVRGHPRAHPVPILVSGHPEDPALLRAAGVDDIMRTDVQPDLAAHRLRDRILRLRALPWDRDTRTGWPNRLGILDALDDEIHAVTRSGRTLTVVLLELEGLDLVEEAAGRDAAADVCRILRGVVTDGLRRTDRYGTLGLPGSVVIGLPGCDLETARTRLGDVLQRFSERIRGDDRFEDVQIAVGAADTELGLADVGVRAEQDLKRRTS